VRLRAQPGPDGRRRPRWGLRTLEFLILAVVALIMSQVSGGYTWGQLGSLVLGLGGAAYCSMRGIYTALETGLLPRRPPFREPDHDQSANGHGPSGSIQS
jgi:peptidoglycan/LPS O-acetylase OafA/YrhL